MQGKLNLVFTRERERGSRALVGFASACCPDAEQSLDFMLGMVEGGVDILEIGVPFSDPMADGPTIQQASQKALKGGARLDDVFAICETLSRAHPETGIVLFSYYNPIFHMGTDRFAERAAAAGADGVLAVDVPYEERGEIMPSLASHGLDLVPLVSPATPEDRAARIADGVAGFIYYIMFRGVTGVREAVPADLAEKIAAVRRVSALPVAAGFGVSSPEMARAVADVADGVVIGSAFVKMQLDDALAAGDRRARACRLAAACKAAIREGARAAT